MNRALLFSAVVVGLWAAPAVAQPANDACEGAIAIPMPRGLLQSRSPAVSMVGAGTSTDLAFSCATSSNASVWFSFTPTVSQDYELSTCLDKAPSSVANTVLAIYEGTCGALTEVAGGCNDNFCASRSRVVVPLTANQTYLVQYAKVGTASTTDLAQVTVQVPSGADTCGPSAPLLALDTTTPVITSERTQNDSEVTLACYTSVGHGAMNPAIVSAAGRDVVHRFIAPADGLYSFRAGQTSSAAANVALYVTNTCVSSPVPATYGGGQCLAAANRFSSSTTSQQEEVECVPLAQDALVYVWADESARSDAGISFDLEVSRCVRESEPNDDQTRPTPLSFCPITAQIADAGDVDFFDLGVAPANARLFAMAEAAASGFNSATSQSTSFDLAMRVVNAGGDVIEFDNDDLDTLWGSTAPGVAGTPLAAGVGHSLRITHQSATSVVNPYHVYAVVQTGTPVAETEPNETTATANVAASNYFSGSVTTTTDNDFFAIQARKGQLIYVGIDGLPTRTGTTTPANVGLELWGADGLRVDANGGLTTVNSTLTTGRIDAGSPFYPSEHILYRATEDGTYFVKVFSSSTNTLGAYLLSIALDCVPGGGFVAPTLGSLRPATGAVTGGEVVTLDGLGFGPGTEVRFGSALATLETISATTLTVRTPIGAAGTVNVTVSNPAGSSQLPNAYTYTVPIAPPTVSAVSPSAGPLDGGALVTIDGALFKPGAEVRFTVGGVDESCTSVTVVSINQLTCVTPAHVPGAATVTVRNPADALEGSLADAYRYNPAPSISAVSPASGLIAGNTLVTITGSGFQPGAVVRFRLTQVTATVDGSGTSLTVRTPVSALDGPVDVTIINPDGQQVVGVDAFTYLLPAPVVTGVSPAFGPTLGGQTITVTGANFTGTPVVRLAGAEALNVSVVSATSLTATTPPIPTGLQDLEVVNPDGQAVVLTGAYTGVPPPGLTTLTPNRGPSTGGTRFTLVGTSLQPGMKLRFGGVPALAVTQVSSTSYTGLTPANMAGPVDVELIAADGQIGVAVGAFTFDPAPVVASVSPAVGSTMGGASVVIRGEGFVTGATVRFGLLAATSVMVSSATELTAVAPMRDVGVVTVTVENPDGQRGELAGAFRYVSGPTVSAVTPASGSVEGGTAVRVTGSGFTSQTTVRFGAVAASRVTFIDSATLEAVSPPGSVGAVEVVVANASDAVASLPGAFTYVRAAPAIVTVSPPSGTVAGGTAVSIVGSGFASEVTVRFGDTAASNVVRVSAELIRAVAPAHAAGVVDVVVRNGDGQSATAAAAFTFSINVGSDLGVVADGGSGTIGGPPEKPEPEEPTGCGCASLDGTAVLAALGLLVARSRRKLPAGQGEVRRHA